MEDAETAKTLQATTRKRVRASSSGSSNSKRTRALKINGHEKSDENMVARVQHDKFGVFAPEWVRVVV